jgi:hypothetical protein
MSKLRKPSRAAEPMGKKLRVKLAPPVLDPRQRYTIAEANALLRQSNSKTFEQIKAGELKVIRDGGRTYVPGSEIVQRSTLPATAT